MKYGRAKGYATYSQKNATTLYLLALGLFALLVHCKQCSFYVVQKKIVISTKYFQKRIITFCLELWSVEKYSTRCIRKEGKGTNPAQISVPLTPKDTTYMTYRLKSLNYLYTICGMKLLLKCKTHWVESSSTVYSQRSICKLSSNEKYPYRYGFSIERRKFRS